MSRHNGLFDTTWFKINYISDSNIDSVQIKLHAAWSLGIAESNCSLMEGTQLVHILGGRKLVALLVLSVVLFVLFFAIGEFEAVRKFMVSVHWRTSFMLVMRYLQKPRQIDSVPRLEHLKTCRPSKLRGFGIKSTRNIKGDHSPFRWATNMLTVRLHYASYFISVFNVLTMTLYSLIPCPPSKQWAIFNPVASHQRITSETVRYSDIRPVSCQLMSEMQRM